MLHDVEFSSLLMYFIFCTARANYDHLSDTTLFSVNWPGPPQQLAADAADLWPDDQTVVMTTKNNEKYRCTIPVVVNFDGKDDENEYSGPTELQLLQGLFAQTSCSYKIESYWTYELCHGKFLRQYHEEKDANKPAGELDYLIAAASDENLVRFHENAHQQRVKLQEYYLGKYDTTKTEAEHSTMQKESTSESKESLTFEERKKKSRKKKVEGVEIPIYEVVYGGGTNCDLLGTPRKTYVHYVCHTEGRGEVYEFKEVSTCEYEVVILTSLLCKHPLYEQKKDPINKIQCHPMDGSPRRPKSLDELELENTQGRYNRREKLLELDEDEKEEDLWDEVDKFLDLYPKVQDHLFPKQEKHTFYEKKERPSGTRPRADDKQATTLLLQFLKGEYCIQGGTGWWKHEFCYGKHITQYHEEKGQRLQVITLGSWNQEKHVEYLMANPHKKPHVVEGARIKTISQYYGGGDLCDVSGKPRFAEVKLKCKDNPAQPHSVSLYLIEPNSCEYTLVVESPILCSMVESANEWALPQTFPQP